ncbi:hypothetical protein D3C71_1856950 [compost metagenome]
MRRAKGGLVAAHRRAQARGVPRGQQRQVLRADLPGTGQHRSVGGLGQAGEIRIAQLQLQTFGHVARADAHRVE